MPRYRSAYFALFVFVFLTRTMWVCAQRPVEIPREEVPRERTEDANGRAEEEELRRAAEGGFHVYLPPGAILLLPDQAAALKEPQTLRWEKTQDASGHPTLRASSSMPGFGSMDLATLKKLLDRGGTFVNEGGVPRDKDLRLLIDAYPDRLITHEPESANRDPQAIRAAIALGDRPLNPARVKVFNALPHETELQGHFQEQTRMGVGGTLDYWKGLHEDIGASSGGMLPHRATRDAVLEELRSGTSDVLMLYAHFDGEQLYMPGAHGGTIRVDELAQIDRRSDPRVRNRIIVLVACSTGARTLENPRSLTSVLLEKGIARTVMATDRPYDSREIPTLLTRLANGTPLRKAVGLHTQTATQSPGSGPAREQSGSFLQQFVELRSPVLNGPAERGEREGWGE